MSLFLFSNSMVILILSDHNSLAQAFFSFLIEYFRYWKDAMLVFSTIPLLSYFCLLYYRRKQFHNLLVQLYHYYCHYIQINLSFILLIDPFHFHRIQRHSYDLVLKEDSQFLIASIYYF